MTGLPLSRRSRSFVLWVAKLAMVAYLVQIVAVDHWQDHSQIIGIEGTAAHAQHCHGAGDCSDGAAGAINNAPSTMAAISMPPQTRLTAALDDGAEPEAAYIASPHQPPRAA